MTVSNESNEFLFVEVSFKYKEEGDKFRNQYLPSKVSFYLNPLGQHDDRKLVFCV